MARPQANNCTYFSHDADMRNHRKVKVLRTKFKRNDVSYGYAVWNMLLEHLTKSDGNTFEHSDVEYDLLSGDFDYPAADIKAVVDYCVKIEMLFLKDGFIYSESLNERLAPVYAKRGRMRELSQKQKRLNGAFATSKAVTPELPIAETPERKEDEIIVKETIIFTEPDHTPPPEDKKKFDFKKALLELKFDAVLVDDWLKVRKKKRLTNTQTALNGFMKEVHKACVPINTILRKCVEKSWGGFEAEWLNNLSNGNGQSKSTGSTDKLRTW